MAIKKGRNPKTVKPRTGRKVGRPVGAATVLTRKQANDILNDGGVTPLDVMVANMRFFHEDSVLLGEEIREKMGKRGTDQEEVISMVRKLIYSRERAQGCAVDLAPYLHPRLSSIAFDPGKGSDDKLDGFTVKFIRSGLK